ncbi:DUF4124 domain-containing protein [Xanthomonas bundabergensis]|uniref:DUF4124 domain-containing protein n=1 Tax=Xanthomonas bundabergensis TaxID=3160842 RepID=UPI003516F36C
MIRIYAAVLCVLALPASAQSAYKCKDPKLGTVYQSMPCANGTEQKRWDTAASAPSAGAGSERTVSEPAAGQGGQRAPAGAGQEPSLGASLISSVRAPGPEACTRARHVRDSARADPTMKNDRDFIQAVEKAVTQACK